MRTALSCLLVMMLLCSGAYAETGVLGAYTFTLPDGYEMVEDDEYGFGAARVKDGEQTGVHLLIVSIDDEWQCAPLLGITVDWIEEQLQNGSEYVQNGIYGNPTLYVRATDEEADAAYAMIAVELDGELYVGFEQSGSIEEQVGVLLMDMMSGAHKGKTLQLSSGFEQEETGRTARIGFTVRSQTKEEQQKSSVQKTTYDAVKAYLLAELGGDCEVSEEVTSTTDGCSILINVKRNYIRIRGYKGDGTLEEIFWRKIDDDECVQMYGRLTKEYSFLESLLPEGHSYFWLDFYPESGEVRVANSEEKAKDIYREITGSGSLIKFPAGTPIQDFYQAGQETGASSDAGEKTAAKQMEIVVAANGKSYSRIIDATGLTLMDAWLNAGIVEVGLASWGFNVITVDGITADYERDGSYWSISLFNAETGEFDSLATPIDQTQLTDGMCVAFELKR